MLPSLVFPGPAEVEPAARELLDTMAPASFLISVSTVSPALIRELDDVAGARGIAVLDAPISGAADGARDGVLTIIVGAKQEACESCRTLRGDRFPSRWVEGLQHSKGETRHQ